MTAEPNETPDATPAEGVRLPARTVPFPRSISAEAQAALRRLVNAEGVPFNALHVLPELHDIDGWMRLKAAADAQYGAALASLAGQLRSSVETVEVEGATVHVATPAEPGADDAIYVDLHGGALVMGGGAACRTGAQMQADQLGLRCWGIDYRMPPEHPYPAALDDCLAVYRRLLQRYPAHRIVVGGRSAGGNLAAAMLLRARDEGLPLPAALVLLSPEVDLTESGDSFALNPLVDVVLPHSLMPQNRLYAAGADLAHPYLSPLFGDFSRGFVPTFIQSGTRDLFLSNAVRLHRALRRANVPCELHVFEAMPHGGFMGAPEDRELRAEVHRFVHAHLPDAT
ncbi:alpha/beta hydrolase [Paraburkholderia acidisoli]|uniref:Alpha/beta hydrolase fold domain-containing protein n=1 Tax=Paraburkholderia acidisoli TaxID=2571748 RepID=A0A7Z2GPL5_9BURK|nr:alpha/beta hydrolase [Paraburkholderia acidisoli]QGZ65369.1 alpha/beta hydrolase fold domain-containing protein [Paraburkholderia acidisoli]